MLFFRRFCHFTKFCAILPVVDWEILYEGTGTEICEEKLGNRTRNEQEKKQKSRHKISGGLFYVTLFFSFLLKRGGAYFRAGPLLFEAIVFWYLFILDYLNTPL